MADQEISIRITAKNLTAEEFAKAREAITGLTEGTKAQNQSAGTSFDQLKSRMMSAFQDPIGGIKQFASEFAGGFLKNLSAGTVAALGTTAALAGVVAGLSALALRAAEAGAMLDDMSDTTGITVPALSGLKFAADVAGVSFDKVTGAIFMMQRRMADNPDAFEKGLKSLNINLAEFNTLTDDEKFVALSRGFREAGGDINRASVSMELFGRQGREMLPLLNLPLEELIARSKELGFTWTNEEAKAAEDLDMKVNELKLRFSNMATIIGRELIPVMLGTIDAFGNVLYYGGQIIGWMTGAIPLWLELKNAWASAAAALDLVLGRMEKLPTVGGEAAKSLKAWKDSVNDRALGPLILTETQEKRVLDELNETLRKQTAEREKATKEIENQRKATEKAIETERKQLDQRLASLTTTGPSYMGLPNVGPEQAPALSATGISAGLLTLPNVKGLPAFTSLTEGFKEAFSKDAPNVILQSLMGGGNPTNAIASMFGGKFGENVVGHFGTKITAKLGDTLGGALNTILPGVGAMVGPLLMKGLGKLGGFVKSMFGGPSQKELDGRTVARDFESMVQSMLSSQQKLEAGGERWKGTVIGVRDAYLNTGRSAAEAEAAVARLWAAEKQGPEAVKAVQAEISGIFAEWKQDQEDLTSAIERYGFTVEELGPKFAKQKLSEQAALLMNDFRLLTDATGDVNLVIEKMSGSINEFIGRAIATGTEVPASMRPLLEKMIDMGKLTDDNGNKIESLEGSGITFSETLTQGFDRVVKKFDELIGKLTDDFPKALRDIKPPTIHVPVAFDVPELPTWTGDTAQGAAAGGLFSRPTLRVIAESKPEMVGSPDVFADAFRKALGDLNVTGGNVDTKAVALEVSKMRGDLRTLGPTLFRAIRDAQLV